MTLFSYVQAIKLGFNDTRCVMEPAGALAIAGMRKYLKDKGLVGHTVSRAVSAVADGTCITGQETTTYK